VTEYGVFNDEGLVVGQFYDVDDAICWALMHDGAANGFAIHEICPDHEDQARETCEACNEGDEED
jgi:hypothetical protein